MNYTYEYSNFPNSIIEIHNFKDVDSSIAVILNTIKSLQSRGLFEEAAKICSENKNILKPYVIDSSVINELVEQIRNTQIYAMSNRQYVYTEQTEPETWIDGDIWIGGE